MVNYFELYLQIIYDYAWVKEDFGEEKISKLPVTSFGCYLPVKIGQKVEIIETKLASLPEFCLARLIVEQCSTAAATPQQDQQSSSSLHQLQGLIPITALSFTLLQSPSLSSSSIMSFKSAFTTDTDGMFLFLFLFQSF